MIDLHEACPSLATRFENLTREREVWERRSEQSGNSPYNAKQVGFHITRINRAIRLTQGAIQSVI